MGEKQVSVIARHPGLSRILLWCRRVRDRDHRSVPVSGRPRVRCAAKRQFCPGEVVGGRAIDGVVGRVRLAGAADGVVFGAAGVTACVRVDGTADVCVDVTADVRVDVTADVAAGVRVDVTAGTCADVSSDDPAVAVGAVVLPGFAVVVGRDDPVVVAAGVVVVMVGGRVVGAPEVTTGGPGDTVAVLGASVTVTVGVSVKVGGYVEVGAT